MACIGILQDFRLEYLGSVCRQLNLNGQAGVIIGAFGEIIQLARDKNPVIVGKSVTLDDYGDQLVLTCRGIAIDREWLDALNSLNRWRDAGGRSHHDGLCAHLTDYHIFEPIVVIDKQLDG